MALDIFKNVVCVRIQLGNKVDADFCACSPVGLISVKRFFTSTGGDQKWHDLVV
jgi:hypothetical protein